MSSYKITYSDELYHHGILGQKWGVRRYQNPDGSLTEEGRRRYASGGPKSNTSSRYIGEGKSGNNVSARDIRRNMDYMTDKELQNAINRLNNQERIEQLAKDKTLSDIVKKGREEAKEIVATIAAFTSLTTILKKTFPTG